MTESPTGEAAEAVLLQIVDAVAAELRPGRAPRPATLQSQLDHDLGFDSLGRVELTSRLDDAFDVSLVLGIIVVIAAVPAKHVWIEQAGKIGVDVALLVLKWLEMPVKTGHIGTSPSTLNHLTIHKNICDAVHNPPFYCKVLCLMAIKCAQFHGMDAKG